MEVVQEPPRAWVTETAEGTEVRVQQWHWVASVGLLAAVVAAVSEGQIKYWVSSLISSPAHSNAYN